MDQTSQSDAQTVVEPSAGAVEAVSTPNSNEENDTPPAQVVIPPANFSPGLAEVVKLAQSGVSESVLMAYVEKSSQAFNPSVDEIVYLKDIGISDAVVAKMVRHTTATGEAAQTPSNPEMAENKIVPETVPTNSTGPSLVAPEAPSYSVAADPNSSVAPAVEQPQEVNINYFENTLAPYGNWVDVPDYGRCWQPTVVALNRNWRPYADRGRWLYTSSGWYWQSDYSWGWAPFHYGRWHNDNRVGWVWVPGSTWGPAWVSWRYTDQYCGWAPLPPSARYYSGVGFYYQNSHVGVGFDFGLNFGSYTFIPTSRFCDRTPNRYYVSGEHSKTIYKNSVVINNYVRGNNNTVINEGVGRARIAKASHTPVRTVALRELPATTSPAGRTERLEGNSLTVFRPNVSTQKPVAAAGSSPNAATPNRSLRSIPKTEKNPATVAAKPVTAPSAPNDPAKTAQTIAPTATHNPSPVPTSPKREISSSERHSVVPNRNAQSVTQEPNKNERREINPTTPNGSQRSLPTSIARTPVQRETPQTRQPIAQPAPAVSPVQKEQPAIRESRRPQQSIDNNAAQRSLHSITPNPARTAPAPAQNFNSPAPQIDRGVRVDRVERSAPPQVSQPRPSAPAPSIRQSAPRQEAPAPRQQIDRSVERGARSERNRS